MKNVKLEGRTYYVRIVVPADVRAALGKRELIQSLETGDYRTACLAAQPVISRFKKQISDARRAPTVLNLTPLIEQARGILDLWLASELTGAVDNSGSGSVTAEWGVPRQAAALEKAATTREGWQAIPDFDRFALGVLGPWGGMKYADAQNVLPELRQEIARQFRIAALAAEQRRIALAHGEAAGRLLSLQPETFAQSLKAPVQPDPLAMFHGCRLSELAALPKARFRQSAKGTWFFDLTDEAEATTNTKVKVKTETSRRLIPLHPAVKLMGFTDYVEGLGAAEWLFPDLDHQSPFGAGHSFSKWFGEWSESIGITDPAVTFHSFRHGWLRRARESEAKKELYRLISGHAGEDVADEYGRGADIEVLAEQMEKITFPAFPSQPPLAVQSSSG